MITKVIQKLLTIGIAVCLMSQSQLARAEEPPTTAILVHGAFADGSSWQKVIPLLREAGLDVIAVQNPLSSLEDDIAHTIRAIDTAKGPVVLVGHSWGGVVITEAGMHNKVKSLVYVSSYAPSPGQSLADIVGLYDIPESFSSIEKDAAGYFRLPETAMQTYFAQDVSAEEVATMAAVQGRINSAALGSPVELAAWQYKPSWFVISENDQIAPEEMQSDLASKIGATEVRVSSSHVPMISQPLQVSSAIIAAANTD